MVLKISKLAQMYFALKGLESATFENFKNSYRVFRNLEILKPIGEKYFAEIEAMKVSSDTSQDELIRLDTAVFNKWEISGETEDLPLKMLDFSTEKLAITPAQIGALEQILENLD